MLGVCVFFVLVSNLLLAFVCTLLPPGREDTEVLNNARFGLYAKSVSHKSLKQRPKWSGGGEQAHQPHGLVVPNPPFVRDLVPGEEEGELGG